MTEKFIVNTNCGKLRVFEKSVLLEGVAKPFFLYTFIDRKLATELIGIIIAAFEAGKNSNALEVAETLRALIHIK